MPMPIEIWSDVMCPFCYLGKRRFSDALAEFEDRADTEVVWRSFQLMPDLKTDPSISVAELLERERGYDPAQLAATNARIADAGRAIGLDYQFDRMIVANTFDAHRLLQMALTIGGPSVQDDVGERLFRSYFSEGKNVADPEVLTDIGHQAGLDPLAVATMLSGGEFTDRVKADIREARELGVNGVPFFVLDRKYAVSGAQDTAVFSQALRQAYDEQQRDRNA